MTDQELLELAAKAADLNIKAQSINADDHWIGLIVGEKHTREKKFWNPLTDDGDAFRLAVNLKLSLYINHAVRVDYHIPNSFPTTPLYEPLEPDVYAATRRAIVRAAAEIGKSIEVTK
mgnify:CR=1 FL=1